MRLKGKQKSTNFKDKTDFQSSLLAYLFDPYAPGPNESYNPQQTARMRKGEDPITIIRENMRDVLFNRLLGQSDANLPRPNRGLRLPAIINQELPPELRMEPFGRPGRKEKLKSEAYKNY